MVILAAGIAAALVSNAVRGDGIPLGSDPRSLRVGAGLPLVDLAAARADFDHGAVFVDARSHALFVTGHVEGALSIPPENAEAAYRADHDFLPDGDGTVVVYASRKEAELAGTRAAWLKTMGHTGVVVMVDGWDAWHADGYPAATGE